MDPYRHPAEREEWTDDVVPSIRESLWTAAIIVVAGCLCVCFAAWLDLRGLNSR